MQYSQVTAVLEQKHHPFMVSHNSQVEKLSYDNFVSFWACHFKHLSQLGGVIPNIHVTLDHFPVTLGISCHFGQCHKRPCFLLVIPLEILSNSSETSIVSPGTLHLLQETRHYRGSLGCRSPRGEAPILATPP